MMIFVIKNFKQRQNPTFCFVAARRDGGNWGSSVRAILVCINFVISDRNTSSVRIMASLTIPNTRFGFSRDLKVFLLKQKINLSITKLQLLHYNVNCRGSCCCCCSAYLSSCHRTASDANLLDNPHTFYSSDYFVIGGIRTCLRVCDDLIFL